MRAEAAAEGGWEELQTWLQKTSVCESKKVRCAGRGGRGGGRGGEVGKREGRIKRKRTGQ